MSKPNVTRVQSATQWTASVHTLHMSKPNVTRVQSATQWTASWFACMWYFTGFQLLRCSWVCFEKDVLHVSTNTCTMHQIETWREGWSTHVIVLLSMESFLSGDCFLFKKDVRSRFRSNEVSLRHVVRICCSKHSSDGFSNSSVRFTYFAWIATSDFCLGFSRALS